VGNWGNIFDQTDVETRRLKRSQRRLSPRAWTSDEDLNTSKSVIHRLFRCTIRCLLGGKRGPFAGAFETHASGTRPRDYIALIVRNRNNRIIEGRVNMNHTLSDIFSSPLLARGPIRRLLLGLPFGFLFRFFLDGIFGFCHMVLLVD
jgi:hypothetical protein